MSIFLKPVQRANPSDPDAPKKSMAIRQLRKVVQRLLLDGKSVKLGDWGTFNVTLSTEGAERKEDLTAHNVKRVNINFQPSDEMKAAMQKADFVWLDKIMENGTASGGDDEEGLPTVQDDETESPSVV